MRRTVVAVALAALLAACSSAQAIKPAVKSCNGFTTIAEFRPWAKSVWKVERWRRGRPTQTTVEAFQRKVECAASPTHREAIVDTWSRDRDRYNRHRHREVYCHSGRVIKGRVSVFGGGLMASGHYTSEPAIALNIAPGTEWGWNNSTTRSWVSHLQRFRVKIEGYGHAAVLFDGDLGPAGFVNRAIDVTEGGAAELGLSVSGFPTDAVGTAKLIPPGCGV